MSQAEVNFNNSQSDSQKLNTDLITLTDTELAQLFVNEHCNADGDKSLGREYLAELIRRDTQRRAIESLELSEHLVTGQNGGYFQALGELARKLVRR